MDVVAGARDVRIDHACENRKKFLQRHGILRRFEILPDGFEIPERRIGGVVFRLASSVRKVVREHAAIHIARKSKKDLLRRIRAAGRKRQPRQSNHGVAAPVAKPVIAGDDAAAVGFFGQAALHNKLIGGKDELPKPRGRFFRKGLVFRLPVLEQFHLVIRALRPGGFSVQQSVCFRGRDKHHTGTDFQFCAEQRGKKAIFTVIKTPRSFFPKKTAKEPLVAWLAGTCTTSQVKRHRAVECQHLYAMLYRRDIHAPVAGMGQGMKVAIIHQRFQFHFEGTASPHEGVLNVRCVFALAHPDSFFQKRIG